MNSLRSLSEQREIRVSTRLTREPLTAQLRTRSTRPIIPRLPVATGATSEGLDLGPLGVHAEIRASEARRSPNSAFGCARGIVNENVLPRPGALTTSM